MKTRKLCRVGLTTDVAKKLTLCHHKGDQRVAFVLDEHLSTVSGSAGSINVSPKFTKSLNISLSWPDQHGGREYVAQLNIEYKTRQVSKEFKRQQ